MSDVKYPLVVTLFEKQHFSGRKRVFLGTENNLKFLAFDNTAHSIKVEKGKDYDDIVVNENKMPKVALYRDQNLGGNAICLGLGDYPALPGDRSSLTFVYEPVPPDPLPPYKAIPLIVKLYAEKDRKGHFITLIDSCEDMKSEYGFDNVPSSIEVTEGPDYNGETVTLYDGKHWGGDSASFEAGEVWDSLADNDLPKPRLNNKASSVKIEV